MSDRDQRLRTCRENILDSLQSDIVSLAEVAQIAMEEGFDRHDHRLLIGSLIKPLLISGVVEIGYASNESGTHVKLTAWRGTATDRIQRLADLVSRLGPDESAYAAWLCLRQNVDGFEQQP